MSVSFAIIIVKYKVISNIGECKEESTMELLRCFFYVDQFKTVPSKRTVINSALGIIFLFLATLNMAGMPLALHYGLVPKMHRILIL